MNPIINSGHFGYFGKFELLLEFDDVGVIFTNFIEPLRDKLTSMGYPCDHTF